MASVGTYLNFPGNTEEAFNFYRSVFGGEFEGDIMRMGDVPASEDGMQIQEEDKNLVMHVSLPILAGHRIMGTDATESTGQPEVRFGNNSYIALSPDSRVEADRLFAALSDGGKVEMPMEDMFWGSYFGSFADKYGVQWMIDCAEKA